MSLAAIFVGPSGFGLDRSCLEGLDVRPPARCGDLLAAVRDGHGVIGLVDGVFETMPAVWHKEILFALSRGVGVIGAASMGALRAAECAPFGMEGMGAVFEDYASGRRTADADVAVAHAPAELAFEPLSVALVDAEATILQALERAEFDATAAERLLAAARRIHFKFRTWRKIVADARLDGGGAILPALQRNQRCIKRDDTLLLVDRLRAPPKRPLQAIAAENFSKTSFFASLERRLAGGVGTPDARG
jgi:hypothetical protein